MLINKHFDCLHCRNCITTVLREAQLLKISVTISGSCYIYVHTHALIVFCYSAFHVIEKKSLLKSGNHGLHHSAGFISCKQLLF